jgi:type I restriction enzyme, S subunit
MSGMNFLERLLDGVAVEWKPLGEVAKIQRGRRLVKSELEEVGKYAVFQNCMTPLGYYHESNVKPDTTFIISAGAAGEIGYSDVDFWAADDVYYFLTPQNLKSKFLYYFLLTQQTKISGQVRRASVPRLSKTAFEKIQIPILPLKVQSEIVRILDTFTALTAELTAELSDRKKQYNYYRDQLFLRLGNNEEKLGDIADICLGLTYTPTYVDSGVKFISAQNTSKDFLDLSNVKYISEDEYRKSTSNAKPKRGDLLFTRVGSNLGHPVIVDTDEPLCMFVSLGFIRVNPNKVLNSYIKHWMNTDLFWDQVRKNTYGAAKINLNTGWLNKFDVLLPSLHEQARIVAILDKFDTLTHSIREGLPREIALRQQQYEYYRDLLLSFPPPLTPP